MPPLTALNSLSPSSSTQASAVGREPRPRTARIPTLAILEFLLDAMVVTGLSAFLCGAWPSWRSFSGSASLLNHDLLLTSVLISSIVMMMLVKSRLYRNSEGLLHIRETACVIEACLSSAVLLIPWAFLTHQPHSVSRLAGSIVLMVLALVIEKQIVYKAVRGLSPERLKLRRTVVFGHGASAKNLFDTLRRSPKSGLYPVAFYDPAAIDPAEGSAEVLDDQVLPINSPTPALLAAHHIDLVIIDHRNGHDVQTKAFIDQCHAHSLAVAFVGDSSHETLDSLKALDLDGQSIYAPHPSDRITVHAALARTLDLTVSITMLIAVSMPALLIALIIKLESEGPILYRQRRVGHNGKLFTILKFRTMYATSCGDALTPSSSNDPRITRSGKWLRKTSLDELPQLLNVLFGEMALVGPRPEMPFIVASYSERQRRRLSVKPGLTGIWQLSPHRSMPIHENMQYDLYYLRQRSFTIDIAILMHTVVRAMNGI